MPYNAQPTHSFAIETPPGGRTVGYSAPAILIAFTSIVLRRAVVFVLFWFLPSVGLSRGQEAESTSIQGIPVENRWWFQPTDIGGYRTAAHEFGWDQNRLRLWGLGRGYFSTDGRVEFTGQETTFGAEAQVLAEWTAEHECFWTSATCESYLNQPFDDNILVDDPVRASFASNFDVDTFELSQMFVSIGQGNWVLDVGRFATPFGRYYGPLLSNSRADGPFIRTESILNRETGLQLRYNPGIWRLSAAVVNGSTGRDTNASKALIARAGFDLEHWVGGASIKQQDGIGSESQKEFNNHIGVDLAWRAGNFMLAGEAIYDQYGLRRPGTDLNDISWGRSLYNRQLNNGLNQPLDGVGWYLNAIWTFSRSRTVIGYGQFHPEPIGDPIHDEMTRRLLAKQTWMLSDRVEWYGSVLLENWLEDFTLGHDRMGYSILSGVQFHF